MVSCRIVKALHIFLLVDGNLAAAHQKPAACDLAMLIPDLVSLLILVKSTLKACCLPHEGHVRLVKDMLLMPVGPGQARLNLLQVRHFALHGHVADLFMIAVGALAASCQKYVRSMPCLSVCVCGCHVCQGQINSLHMTANKANLNQS